MVNPKRLVAMARKWQKLAAKGRKRISMPRADADASKKSAPSKGQFIIYTTDGKRFAVPLAYHNSLILREMFRMSEDEYGLPSNGPIMMPFDAVFVDYIVSLIQRPVPKDLERAPVVSLATSRCSAASSLHQPYANPSISVHG